MYAFALGRNPRPVPPRFHRFCFIRCNRRHRSRHRRHPPQHAPPTSRPRSTSAVPLPFAAAFSTAATRIRTVDAAGSTAARRRDGMRLSHMKSQFPLLRCDARPSRRPSLGRRRRVGQFAELPHSPARRPPQSVGSRYGIT